MPFKKRHLCSEITLLISAGILLSAIPRAAEAQLPLNSCRANAAGDGWICERSSAAGPANVLHSVVNSSGTDSSSSQSTSSSSDTRSTISPANIPKNDYDLDWVPREQLTPSQLERLEVNCCGAYVDPTEIGRNLDDAPSTADLSFVSDQGVSQSSPNLINIDGDIVVQQGYRTVANNDSTTIDREQNTVLMRGNIVFREPGILLTGNSAYIESNEGLNQIESAQYVLHDYGVHGSAETIIYNSESGLVSIENGEFSRCEPESNFWHFSAEKIVLDQELGRGYATAVTLRIKDLPVFYYPGTLPFPLGDERISGFLSPSTGSTRNGGFDFELPYYFNLAPNYDATISPRLISDRGILTSLEFRYLANTSMNTLNMSYLGGDKLYDSTTANVAGSDSPPTDNRWFVGYEHFGNYGNNWSSFVDYNAVSDEDYFYDLGSSGLNTNSRTHLNRQGRLNFDSKYLSAGVNVQRIQIIDPFVSASDLNTPYDRLPQFHFRTGADLGGGFRLTLAGQVTSFDRNLDESLLSLTQLNDGALVNGERLNLEPEISWSREEPGWFLRANAKYNHASYQLQNQASTSMDDPDLGIGTYNLDGGLIFERQMSNGFTQTLEPRLYYLFSEYEDQNLLPLFDTSELNFSFNQLFRNDRFSGGDRIADADQVSIAITSRILDSKGKERARLAIGQISYFDDRLVSLSNPIRAWLPRYSPLTNTSAYAAEFAYAFGDNWKLHSDLQWNEDTQEIDEASFQLRYQRDSNHLLNLSYRYRNLITSPTFILPPGVDSRIKQTDFSGVWPISQKWKLLARWNYDHSNSRNLETFAGIEYSNCCATIRIIGREWVDEDELFVPNTEPNRGIFVQFTLHGLGNITGGGVSSLLRDGIRGFRESEYE
ncbi:MAG: hypothetical protein COA96_13280 [SAR86 cluster bacterium]|uniref:LPS-assembly protein LptD n=1 Tax=SAR86 cluster bacterium TaxID=2030880 RepID=A0A2A5AU85_9GAMM|nr:MAG: hypothetical protein COA96_13280 [SAR86 cluster bacterium]